MELIILGIYLIIGIIFLRRKTIKPWLWLMGLYIFVQAIPELYNAISINLQLGLLQTLHYIAIALIPLAVYVITNEWFKNTRLAVNALFFTIVIGCGSLTDPGIFNETLLINIVAIVTMFCLFINIKGFRNLVFVSLLLIIWLSFRGFFDIYYDILGRGWMGLLVVLPISYLVMRIKSLRMKKELRKIHFRVFYGFWNSGDWMIIILFLVSFALPGSIIYYISSGMLAACVWDRYFVGVGNITPVITGVLFGIAFVIG